MTINHWLNELPALRFIAIPALLLWLAYKSLSIYLLRRMTGIHDMLDLGTKRQNKLKGTAVVCGGSISGLLTARICADHFSSVFLVDPELSRDAMGKEKTRIMQYDSSHGYLPFLVQGLRQLWPNLDSEVKKMGGLICPGDFKTFYDGVYIPAPYDEYESGGLPETIALRRSHLESLMERLVLRGSLNINVFRGIVRKVLPSKDRRELKSVVVREVLGEEIYLDDVSLVADCTGSTQAGFKWLEAAGYDIPDSTRVSYDQKMHYVTITFAVSKYLKDTLPIPGGYESRTWLYTFVADYQWDNAGFVLTKMDNETIQLCCGGWGDVDLPTDPRQIIIYVRGREGREPIPEWVLESVSLLAEHGSPIFKPVKIPACSYIRYHNVSGLPSNFVSVGDSTMKLNPVFAQGCSHAMLGAVTLDALLRSQSDSSPRGLFKLPHHFASTYYRRLSHRAQSLWDSTKALDYGFETTEPIKGETLQHGKRLRWYTDNLLSVAASDNAVASALWHVRMMAAPPTDLFAPRIVGKILFSVLSKLVVT